MALQQMNSIVESQGCEALQAPDYIFDAAEEADILVTQFCPVNQALLSHCKNLKVVGILRAGLENINVAFASQKNIVVLNTPGRNADAVADYTIGLMIAEARNIAKGHHLLKQGVWERQYPNTQSIPDFCGKRVGLIGFGCIGRKVARRLSGFDVQICCYDPYVSEYPDEIESCSLEVLMETCDFISIHVRSCKETQNLISREMIARMKRTAYLINTARPAILDEAALVEALQEHRIAGAALDVFLQEPPGPDHPLVQLDNVTITPHMAGGTRDAFYLSPSKLAQQMDKLWIAGENPASIANHDVFDRLMTNRKSFF